MASRLALDGAGESGREASSPPPPHPGSVSPTTAVLILTAYDDDRYVTGLLCPGCGTLRGLHQLLHGHLAAAFRLNPVMVLSLPLLGYVALASVWRRWHGLSRRPARPALAWAAWASCA